MDPLFIPKILVPATAVAAVLAVLGYLTRTHGGGRWAVLLATAGGLVAGHRALLGVWPTPASAEASTRVTLAVVATAALAVGLAHRRAPAWAGLILVGLATVATLSWVAAAYPTPSTGGSRSDFWFDHAVMSAALAAALYLLVEPIAARSPGPAAAWVCGCLSVGLGLVQLFSSYTQPGMLTAAAGAVLGGTFLVAAAGFGPRLDRGPVAVWAVLLVSLTDANRVGGGDWPIAPVVVLALAPVLAWVGEVGPVHRWRPWKRELLRGAVVAVPVVVAVVMIVRRHAAEAAENGGY